MSKKSLPQGWTKTELKDVVKILDGKRIPVNARERKLRKGNIPYYGATGQVGWIDDYIFNEELVLLGEDGAPFLEKTKRKAYVIDGKSWVNNHAHVLKTQSGLLTKTLCYYLNQIDYKKFVGGTTRLKLTQASMRSIPILIPPLSEQKLIVAKIESILGQIDAARGGLENAKTLLKQARQSVLKQAFEGKMVPQDPKDEPTVIVSETVESPLETEDGQERLPAGWGMYKIGSLIEPSKERHHPTNSENRVFLGLEHIESNNGKILGQGNSCYTKSTKTVFRQGDLLYGRLRPYLNKVHVADFDGVCSTDILVFPKQHNVSNQYIGYFLSTSSFVNFATHNSIGVQHPRIKFDTISKFRIPLPPLNEQRRIVEKIESILGGIDANGILVSAFRNLLPCFT